MEIKGRECEEVKIGENTYYFITKFKGREYMKIQGMVLNEMDLKDKGSQTNKAVIFANIPLLFSLFCLQVDDGSKEITEDYLDDIEMEDFEKIQQKVTEILTNFFTKIQ